MAHAMPSDKTMKFTVSLTKRATLLTTDDIGGDEWLFGKVRH